MKPNKMNIWLPTITWLPEVGTSEECYRHSNFFPPLPWLCTSMLTRVLQWFHLHQTSHTIMSSMKFLASCMKQYVQCKIFICAEYRVYYDVNSRMKLTPFHQWVSAHPSQDHPSRDSPISAAHMHLAGQWRWQVSEGHQFSHSLLPRAMTDLHRRSSWCSLA